jgi:hypothetical protein
LVPGKQRTRLEVIAISYRTNIGGVMLDQLLLKKPQIAA